MSLPPPETPLYNHSLTSIEAWLREQGCKQSEEESNCWEVEKSSWKADIEMDIEDLVVRYYPGDGSDMIQRSFSYALRREDLDAAIFSGP